MASPALGETGSPAPGPEQYYDNAPVQLFMGTTRSRGADVDDVLAAMRTSIANLNLALRVDPAGWTAYISDQEHCEVSYRDYPVRDLTVRRHALCATLYGYAGRCTLRSGPTLASLAEEDLILEDQVVASQEEGELILTVESGSDDEISDTQLVDGDPPGDTTVASTSDLHE